MAAQLVRIVHVSVPDCPRPPRRPAPQHSSARLSRPPASESPCRNRLACCWRHRACWHSGTGLAGPRKEGPRQRCAARSPGWGRDDGDGIGSFQSDQPNWLVWQLNAAQRAWATVLGLLRRCSDVLYPALRPYNVQYSQVEVGVKVVSLIAALLVIRSLVSVFLALSILAAAAYAVLYLRRTQQTDETTSAGETPQEEAEQPVNRNRGRFRRSNPGSDLVDVWYEEEKRK